MALFRRRKAEQEMAARAAAAAKARADLEQMGAPEALQALQHERRASVRVRAVKVLGESGDASAVGPLVEALTEEPATTGDNVPMAAAQALEALDRKGYDVQPELLLAALPRVRWGTGKSTAHAAIVADKSVALLRAHVGSRHIPALTRWLHDQAVEDRIDAADQALRTITGPEADRRRDAARAAREMYVRLHRIALEVLPRVNDQAVVAALVECDRATRGAGRVRGRIEADFALKALCKAVHPSKIDALIGIFNDPPRDDPSMADRARRQIANYLSFYHSKDPRAFEPTLSWVDTGGSPRSLSHFGSQGVKALLARVERSGGGINEDVVRALAELRNRDAVDRLLQVLEKHGLSTPGANAVVEALGQIGDPRAVDGLVRVLDAPDLTESGLNDVVRALGRIDDQKAVDGLLRVLDAPALPESSVTEVAQALGRSGDPRAAGRLLQALETPDLPETLKRVVVGALVQLGEQRAVPVVSAMLGDAADRDDESGVASLAMALIKLGDRSVLPLLRRVDPGPVTMPYFNPESGSDYQQALLESRQKLHEAIAAFENGS